MVAAIGFEPILNTFSTWSLCRRLGYAAMLWGAGERSRAKPLLRRPRLRLRHAPVLRPGIEPDPPGCPPATRAYKTRCSTTSCRSVALRRGVEPLSTARQAVCDTGRITQDESPPGAIRTPNPAFGGRGPIHLAGRCVRPAGFEPAHPRVGGAAPIQLGTSATAVAPGVRLARTTSRLTGERLCFEATPK